MSKVDARYRSGIVSESLDAHANILNETENNAAELSKIRNRIQHAQIIILFPANHPGKYRMPRDVVQINSK